MSRHSADLRESAEFPTGVKEAVAMCARANAEMSFPKAKVNPLG
jgi:hypothetical protein